MKQLLKDAAEEIRSLRRRNEILSAKVEMIDLFACVLNTQPAQRVVGGAVDVAWELDKEISRIQQREDEKKTKGK